MTCSFTLAHYAEICGLLIDNQYQCIFYDEDSPAVRTPVVILRHDIDQSLEEALKMAEIERRYGLKSTYFVRLRAPFYNVLDPEQKKIVRRIHEMGHHIGLHFDEAAYELTSIAEFNKAVACEAQVLGDLCGVPVSAVSMHRPSRWALQRESTLGGYLNAYSNRFFKEYKYLSDSRRTWREGCACSVISARAYPLLHLLTHAFWWTESPIPTVEERVERFLDERREYADHAMAANVSTYRPPKKEGLA